MELLDAVHFALTFSYIRDEFPLIPVFIVLEFNMKSNMIAQKRMHVISAWITDSILRNCFLWCH